ncbi:MAG: Mth938-like domain-containing protein [Alphaproteobacteria bacterium]
MDLEPKPAEGRQPIQSYGDGGFRIAERRIEGAMLVLPMRAVAWPVDAMASITLDSLGPLREAAGELDLLLLGCGPRIEPLDAGVRREVRNWGIAIELMDTGAACRTYNVLLAEERRVAAALLPV